MATEVREFRVYGVGEASAELERRWPGRWEVERCYVNPERKHWPYLEMICRECGETWSMSRLDTFTVFTLGQHVRRCLGTAGGVKDRGATAKRRRRRP